MNPQPVTRNPRHYSNKDRSNFPHSTTTHLIDCGGEDFISRYRVIYSRQLCERLTSFCFATEPTSPKNPVDDACSWSCDDGESFYTLITLILFPQWHPIVLRLETIQDDSPYLCRICQARAHLIHRPAIRGNLDQQGVFTKELGQR